nr:hypothetical protein [Tanacetum cinerariifolium]
MVIQNGGEKDLDLIEWVIVTKKVHLLEEEDAEEAVVPLELIPSNQEALVPTLERRDNIKRARYINKPGNDVHADDVDIRPIHDEEPMAKACSFMCLIFDLEPLSLSVDFVFSTTYYLPKEIESAFAKPHHVIASSNFRNSSKNMPRFSSNDMVYNHYLAKAKNKTQDVGRNFKPSVMPSARSQSTANGSKPKPRINNQNSRNRPASKSSCVTKKTVPIAEHSRNSRNFFDSKHFVCLTCQKCVFNANHGHCVTKFLNEVNSRAKARVLKTKTFANSDIKDPSSETKLQGRLLVSFRKDAKYKHVGQDTRSQGGKEDQNKQGKYLKISKLKIKSTDSDKGSTSKIKHMKEQAYNIIKVKDSRTQRQSNLNKFKEARFKILPQELEDHILREIITSDLNDPKDSSKNDKVAQTVTLEIHHGGFFTPIPSRSYVGRQPYSFEEELTVVECVEDPFEELDDILGEYAYTRKQITRNEITGNEITGKQMVVYVGVGHVGKFKKVEVDIDNEAEEESDIEGDYTIGSDLEDSIYDLNHDEVFVDGEHIVEDVDVSMNNFYFTADPKHDISIGDVE